MSLVHTETRQLVSNLFIRLLSILAEERIGVAEELKGFGLSRREIDNLSEDVDFKTFYQFVEYILSRHSLPALGVRFGGSLTPGDWGMLGTGILSCESVWDAYLEFGDIQEYSGDLVKLDISERGPQGIVGIGKLDRPALVPFYHEFVLANTWTNFILPIIQSPSFEAKLSKVQFSFSEYPGCLPFYQQLFDCPIEFGADGDELHFPKQLLYQPNSYRNKGAMQFCLEQIQSVDRQMGGVGSHTNRVEERLACALTDSMPTLDDMARGLALSSRTLRRRLEVEGTSYREIVQKVRMDMATYYLTRTPRPVEHIADTLQYSSITSFSRAFKHFKGVSPRQYRTNHL